MTAKKPATVSPIDRPDQMAFRSAALRSGLMISLSQGMLEALCALAENTRPNRFWDYVHGRRERSLGMGHAHVQALAKRGLVAEKTKEQFDLELSLAAVKHGRNPVKIFAESEYPDLPDRWHLTPCGEALVELLKCAGVFVESDQATFRKARA